MLGRIVGVGDGKNVFHKRSAVAAIVGDRVGDTYTVGELLGFSVPPIIVGVAVGIRDGKAVGLTPRIRTDSYVSMYWITEFNRFNGTVVVGSAIGITVSSALDGP